MPLEAVKCPQCGANVEVESNTATFFCTYCGTRLQASRSSMGVLSASILSSIKDDTKIIAKRAALQHLKERLTQLEEQRRTHVIDLMDSRISEIKQRVYTLEAEVNDLRCTYKGDVMPQRRSDGFSFSWKRALSISTARSLLAHASSVPTNGQGSHRKYSRVMGYGIRVVGLVVIVALSLTLTGCVLSDAAAEDTIARTSPTIAATDVKGTQIASVTPEPSVTFLPSRTTAPSVTPRATSTFMPTEAPSPASTKLVAPTETSLPTEEPTQEAVAEPTQEPTLAATEASGEQLLDIVSVTSPVLKGDNASLTVHTAAGVPCQITVYYKSGASKAKGLEAKNADDNGNVTWTWKVGSATTAGDWKIVVKVIIDGQEVTKEVYFTVQ